MQNKNKMTQKSKVNFFSESFISCLRPSAIIAKVERVRTTIRIGLKLFILLSFGIIGLNEIQNITEGKLALQI